MKKSFKLNDFDFDLPSACIAQTPKQPRDSAKLLEIGAKLEDLIVADLPFRLETGDLLVVNDTKVIPARLHGKRGKTRVQVTLTQNLEANRWKVFAKPGRPLRIGEKLKFDGIPRSNMLKVLNFDLFSIGYVNPDDAGCETFEEISGNNYSYFVFRDNRLIGSITLGDTSLSAEIKHAIEDKTDFSDVLCDEPSARKIINILTPQP